MYAALVKNGKHHPYQRESKERKTKTNVEHTTTIAATATSAQQVVNIMTTAPASFGLGLREDDGEPGARFGEIAFVGDKEKGQTESKTESSPPQATNQWPRELRDTLVGALWQQQSRSQQKAEESPSIAIHDHVPYDSGDIEAVESSYFAHAEYLDHQHFFPHDTENDIRETIGEDFEKLGEPVVESLTRVVTKNCGAGYIVLVGLFGNSVRVDLFKKA